MNERNLLRVLGEDNLCRDPQTGAILNTNEQAREEHLRKINQQKRMKDQVGSLEGRMERMENNLNEIQSQLKALINILTEVKE